MIFGQGAIRCHPYALREMQALMAGDAVAFDKAFWPHIGHVIRNFFRSLGLSLTRGRLAKSPVDGVAAPYWRKLAWSSATFAFLADMAMGTLGGDLKRKEKLTGRFADIFSWMYLSAATLRRFESEGRRAEDIPLLHWSQEYAFAQMQTAFDGLFQNLKVPGATWLFRGPIAAWSRFNHLSRGASDGVGHAVAELMLTPGTQRDRLLDGLYVSDDPSTASGRLEHAMQLAYLASGTERKVKEAIRRGVLPRAHPTTLMAAALEKGIITASEAELAAKAERARYDAIQVDAFQNEDYFRSAVDPNEIESTVQQTVRVPSDSFSEASGDGASTGGEAGAVAYGVAVETQDPAARK